MILCLVANIPIVLVKLFSFIPLCKYRNSLRRRKNYLNTRIAFLTLFGVAIVGQCVVSIMAISRSEYYNNVTFGYCSICFGMEQSKRDYESEFISVKTAENKDGFPRTPSYGMN